RPRQRHRHRAAVLGADFRHLPTVAHAAEISRHRNRPGHLQTDRRTSRRQDLARFPTRPRNHVLFHPFVAGTLRVPAAVWSFLMIVNPIELLLVEDSEPDVRLTIEALHEAKVKNRLWVVEDGVEAMEFLR